MSQSKGKNKQRPLGSLRHHVSTNEKINIPRLICSATDTKIDDKLDRNYRGIQGNAMTVPPTYSRESCRDPLIERSSVVTPPAKDPSSRLQESADKKDLKEALAREKSLKLHVSALEKLIEELRAQLKDKDKIIVELDEKIKTQDEDHKDALQSELNDHEETKLILDSSNKELDNIKSAILLLKEEHSTELEQLKNEIIKLNETISSNDKEITIRDEKLGRLKLQMADALKGNSWERQQQLEELTKELSRLQDESDMLRIKLKSHTKSKQGQCLNCVELNSKLERTHSAAVSKDKIIKELNELIARYENQLTKQDELLKSWADSKGHKVQLPK